MEQDSDSQHKRPHDLISRDDPSNAGSAHSTPRKRAKQAGKLGHQDVRDFVPVGGSFSTAAVPIDEAQEHIDQGSQVMLSPKAENRIDHETEISEVIPPQSVQAAPPVNWNAVNTKIRTTLGGSAGKFKTVVDEPSLENGARKWAEIDRDTATSVALERVEGLRIRLSGMDPHDGPVSAYKSAEDELHDAEVDYNYCLYYPLDEEFCPPPGSAARNPIPKGTSTGDSVRMWDMIERCMKEGTLPDLREKGRLAAWLKGAPPSIQSAVQAKNPENGKYHGPQDTSESDAGVILNLEYETQGDLPSYMDNQNIEEPPVMSHGDEDPSAIDSGAASNSDTESNESDVDSESEDGDAMMQYSNSEQQLAPDAPPVHRASILADLSSYELNAQLRYFHTTKAREEVDRKIPVRCLVCAKEGHMADWCESLTCSTCGAFNLHMTQACPENAKCGKCREQGHDEGNCPYKLKRMSAHEIVCDLCQRNGHIEEDCELIWRTSGRPWESNLAHANIRLSCYECGHSGHLGNDCPSRKPNKSMGTSTWNCNMGLVSIKSTRDFKIKGKATQQDPIDLDDSGDDRAKFFRPKISAPEPVRKGQIRIVTGRHESPIYEPTSNDRHVYADHRRGSFTPVSGSYRNDEARHPYQPYRDSKSDTRRAGDKPYSTGHTDFRYNNHGPVERRSRSPLYRDHGGHAGGSSWVPPRPADRRPSADANIYRPMPSAAQNAWTRRRM